MLGSSDHWYPAIAGSLARRRRRLPPRASRRTSRFVGLVIGVVLIVRRRAFFPALALGPIVEQLSTPSDDRAWRPPQPPRQRRRPPQLQRPSARCSIR